MKSELEIANALNQLAAPGWVTLKVPVTLSPDVWARIALYAKSQNFSDDPIETLGSAINSILNESNEAGFIGQNVFKWTEELSQKEHDKTGLPK
jgi:hypothetical protein